MYCINKEKVIRILANNSVLVNVIVTFICRTSDLKATSVPSTTKVSSFSVKDILELPNPKAASANPAELPGGIRGVSNGQLCLPGNNNLLDTRFHNQ